VNYLIVILFSFVFSLNCFAQDSLKIKENKRYYFFPKAYKKYKYSFNTGISITRLPTEVVEEEINTSPVLNGNFRLGLPWKFSMDFKFSTNYVSNLGGLTIYRSFINKKFSFAIGSNTSIWFGHLEMQTIKLKSYGLIYSPLILAGYDFKKFLITLEAEINYGFMKTFSNDELLGKFNQPRSLYAVKVAIEQPLWNNHSVILSVKSNYARFYYQSWLSYSTIKDYLYYPEFSFAFIF
jgi:hypothetical protein